MLALLSKLLPVKDWLYVGAFIALIVTFGVYTHHERFVGEQKIAAIDTKLAAAQAVKVQKVEANANTDISTSSAAYSAAISAPLLPMPQLVCHSATTSGSGLRGNAGASASSHGETAVPAESTVPFDPAPAVINDARDADAQVTLLQAYILACQKAGACQKE